MRPEELRDRAAARHRSGHDHKKTLTLIEFHRSCVEMEKFQATTAAARHQNWAQWQSGSIKTQEVCMDAQSLGVPQVCF